MSFDDRDAIFAVSDDGLLCQTRHPYQWAGSQLLPVVTV